MTLDDIAAAISLIENERTQEQSQETVRRVEDAAAQLRSVVYPQDFVGVIILGCGGWHRYKLYWNHRNDTFRLCFSRAHCDPIFTERVLENVRILGLEIA
jgi:hypothetical protein